MARLEQKQQQLDVLKQKKQRRRRVLSALGVVVVLATALALMLPAISATRDTLPGGGGALVAGSADFDSASGAPNGPSRASDAGSATRFDESIGYVLYAEKDGTYYVLKTDGTTEAVGSLDEVDRLKQSYKWRIHYVYVEKDNDTPYYNIYPVSDNSRTLSLNNDGQDLVQSGVNNIGVLGEENPYQLQGRDGTSTKLVLRDVDGVYKFVAASDGADETPVVVYEQRQLPAYSLTVETDDAAKGKVAGVDEAGATITSAEAFDTVTTSDGTYKNRYPITAVPNNKAGATGNKQHYLFDHWELNGTALDSSVYGQSIAAGGLEIPFHGSDLKAVFVRNSNYDPDDDEKQGTYVNKEELAAWLQDLKSKQVPLDTAACKKTAEVYDYENRIYRVDLTSRSNLTTFAGTVDLGFIIDVSGSMKFPSKLVKVTSLDNPWETPDNIPIRNINNDWYGQTFGEAWGLDTDTSYFIISDAAGTSTVYEISYKQNWVGTDKQSHTGWFCMDASKNPDETKTSNGVTYHNNTEFITGDTKFKSENDPTSDNDFHYQLYTDGDNGKKRRNYLESSLSGTLTEMRSILQVLSLADDSHEDLDPDVKVAWNTFCNYIPNTNTSDSVQRQPTFTSVKDGINIQYAEGTYAGGTSTDIALLDAVGVKRSDVLAYNDIYDASQHTRSDGTKYYKYSDWDCNSYSSRTYQTTNNGFDWSGSATKYAVLITDGAPQRGGKPIDPQYVKEAAEQLKAKGIKLITVGLSMEDVKNGSILLYDIADNSDKTGEKLFYSAKSGDELQYVLLEIIRQILQDATVQGDVVDTIGEAFYPVDKASGMPLSAGTFIDLEGNVIKGADGKPVTDESAITVAHGKVLATNDSGYQIKWTGQEFPHDGWHGSVYVKAKEDLIGGNAVKTNNGVATVDAKSYTVPGSTTPVPLGNIVAERSSLHRELPTPLVNVNELNFTQNETEWTVYLGTEVDPKAELKKLYESIEIEEVVTKAEDTDNDGLPDRVASDGELNYPYREDNSDARESERIGTPQTFYMKDLVKKLTGSGELDWDKLIADANKADSENGGITIPYHVYGINDDSYLNIKLTKSVAEGEIGLERSPHDTAVTGDGVEQYNLTVFWRPDYKVVPPNQSKEGVANPDDFHTGDYGLKYQGHAAGTENSINEHTINVFKKSLMISKWDAAFDHALKGAEFKLYRTARDGDTGTVEIDGLEGKYKELKTININKTEPELVLDPVEKLPVDEKYYLVETKAPDGYNKLIEPVQVRLAVNDSYVPKPGEQSQATKPEGGLYDWTEMATVEFIGVNAKETNAEGDNGYQHDASDDSKTTTVYFKIPNNPGVELPMTGGPGTMVLTLLGSALVAIGTAVLAIRKRTARAHAHGDALARLNMAKKGGDRQ